MRVWALLFLILCSVAWGQGAGRGGSVETRGPEPGLQSFDLQAAITKAFWGAFESNLENDALRRRNAVLEKQNEELRAGTKRLLRAAYWAQVVAVTELFLIGFLVALAMSRVTVVRGRRENGGGTKELDGALPGGGRAGQVRDGRGGGVQEDP